MQDGLELSTEQQQSMLDARQRLLKALTTIRQDREKIILELGLALLQKQAVSPADTQCSGRLNSACQQQARMAIR